MQDLYWLDDDRLVFIGHKLNQLVSEDGRQVPGSTLVVWNITKKEIRAHADLSGKSRLCAADGYIRYDFDRQQRTYARSGVLGSERESEVDVQAMREGDLEVSPISCREYPPKALKKRYGENPLLLSRPGEYLDRTLRHDGSPMRYFPEDGKAPIALTSIPARDVSTTPRYSAYARKYVFPETRFRIAPDATQSVWLVDHAGAVTQTTLPRGPWMGGSTEAMPSARGWILTSTAVAMGRKIGAAGIYLIRGDSATRLIAGVPSGFAVSRDGCKVAASIDTVWTESSEARVMLINVCSKEE